MSLNFFDLIGKYQQFQQVLKALNQSPERLLEQELKKRNISKNELNEMINQAKQISQLFGQHR